MKERVPIRWAEGKETLGWNAVECWVYVVELMDGRVVRQEVPVGSQTEPAWRLQQASFDVVARGFKEIPVRQRAFAGRVLSKKKVWR